MCHLKHQEAIVASDLIQRYHHMRTRSRSRNDCKDGGIIRIAHYMISNNVDELGGVHYKQQRP